jgi:hypothetical protein
MKIIQLIGETRSDLAQERFKTQCVVTADDEGTLSLILKLRITPEQRMLALRYYLEYLEETDAVRGELVAVKEQIAVSCSARSVGGDGAHDVDINSMSRAAEKYIDMINAFAKLSTYPEKEAVAFMKFELQLMSMLTPIQKARLAVAVFPSWADAIKMCRLLASLPAELTTVVASNTSE